MTSASTCGPVVRFALTDRWELAASVLFNNTDNLNDRVVEVSAYYALLSWLDMRRRRGFRQRHQHLPHRRPLALGLSGQASFVSCQRSRVNSQGSTGLTVL